MPYLDPATLQPYLDARLLTMQRHHEHPELCIVNYTAKCQYERAWDGVTMDCRGMILDTVRETVVANPFPKFYNWGDPMVGEVPLEEPIITEKLDGSLGILYWIGDQPNIATRGSFISDQALWATNWFENYIYYESLPRHVTYLFEIVYPENRIVVTYPYEGCVLLAARDTATGADYATIPFQHLFPLRAQRIPATDLATLAAMDEPNSEGFVLHWPQYGKRLKIKFPTYCALHKIITGLSVKGIWEHLATNGSIDDLLNLAPDEMYSWLRSHIKTFHDQYRAIEIQSKDDVAHVLEYATRKDQALWLQRQAPYPGICFQMLDHKDYSSSIWKLLKPTGSETFRQESEDV